MPRKHPNRKRTQKRRPRSKARSRLRKRSRSRSRFRSRRYSGLVRKTYPKRSKTLRSKHGSRMRIRGAHPQDHLVDFSNLKEPKSMSDVKFNYYIKKVLKRVKPRLGITGESQHILDRLMKEMLHQIACRAASKMGRRKVLIPKVIIRGMRQILPKAMRIEADQRAQMAVKRFMKSKNRKSGY